MPLNLIIFHIIWFSSQTDSIGRQTFFWGEIFTPENGRKSSLRSSVKNKQFFGEIFTPEKGRKSGFAARWEKSLKKGSKTKWKPEGKPYFAGVEDHTTGKGLLY